MSFGQKCQMPYSDRDIFLLLDICLFPFFIIIQSSVILQEKRAAISLPKLLYGAISKGGDEGIHFFFRADIVGAVQDVLLF